MSMEDRHSTDRRRHSHTGINGRRSAGLRRNSHNPSSGYTDRPSQAHMHTRLVLFTH